MSVGVELRYGLHCGGLDGVVLIWVERPEHMVVIMFTEERFLLSIVAFGAVFVIVLALWLLYLVGELWR